MNLHSTQAQRLLRRMTVAIAIAACFAVATPAAQAYSFNRYTIVGLGQYVTGPTQFTVEIDGTDPVCKMEFRKQSLTAAPWVFTLKPADLEFGWAQVVATTCDGDEGWASVEATVPWSPYRTLLQREQSVNGKLSLWVSSSINEDANAVVTDLTGRTLGGGPIVGMKSNQIQFTPTSRAAVGKYKLAVTSATSGMTMSFDVAVAYKWTTMDDVPSYPLCSTVTWWYDSNSAPRTVSTANLRRDIKGALARLSRLSGLNFVESSTEPAPGGNTLTFDWHFAQGSYSHAIATGGYVTSNGVSGHVAMNRNSRYIANERYGGFKTIPGTGNYPGRGWVLVHEVMHAMAFDHTTDRNEVMYPVARYAKFGVGDLAGLRYFYQPQTCSK